MTVAQVASLTSFSAGQVISSSAVNNNYAAVRNAFNLLVTANDTLASGLTLPSPTFSGTVGGTPAWTSTQSLSTSGNAATATALQTGRAINGVTFDGTAAITVTAAAGTLTGTTLAAGVTASSLTSFGNAPTLASPTLSGTVAGTPTWASTQAMSISGTASGGTSGNAATATALQTARAINGVSFNGTADITVTAAAGTLTGTTLAATVVNSSLTSVGTLGSLSVTGTATAGAFSGPLTGNVTGNATGSSGSCTGNAATATALQTARTIGGVSFDGTANITVASATAGFTVGGGNLALGINSLTMTGSIGATGARVTKGWFADLEATNAIAGSVTGSSGSTTGNAATATALATPRAINGVNFDGTAAITVTAAAGTLTGATLAAGVTASSLTSFGNAPSLASPTLSGTVAGTPTWASTQSLNTSGNATTATTATSAGSCTGNAATATALQTARNINGVSFSGTADITTPTGIVGGFLDLSLGAGLTNYAPILGGSLSGGAVTSLEAASRVPVPRAGTLRNLYVRIRTNQGAGGSLVCTVMQNGVATALVATFAAGTTGPATASDTSNTVTVAAGDTIALRIVNNDTGSSGLLTGWTCEFVT